MTWLFSLYWLGAIAVAGPILFHMWRRTPRGERSFSTLMFLSPSPPRITSRSRVENWLLMLLRAAAIGLLAFAFTRPLWRLPVGEAVESSDEQLVAIVVDTSASMRREGLWDDLMRQLDERLATSPPQMSVALFRFDRQFLPVAGFGELKGMDASARRELVRTRLKELKPTWESTRLGDALVRAATALQEVQTERSRPARQKIWLASDLQSGAETIALQGYEWPDQLPVEVIVGKPVSPSNAGIQVVERNPESGDDVLRVRITNSVDSVKEQFQIRWDSSESPETSVYVPPGQSRIVVPPKLAAGVSSSSLILTGDDHDFDNRVFVAETAPETRLVVWCGPQLANDPQGSRFYIDRLFSASHHVRIELRDPLDANAASADAQPSLIVMTSPDAASESLVRSHLQRGGTVLIVGDSAESTQASLRACGCSHLSVTEANVAKYSMLGEINFEHPIFAPFAESQFSDFTGIRFWKHRTVSGLRNGAPVADGSVNASNEASDRVLARFDDGDPAIMELSTGKGKIVLFASGWQPDDSQFARSSKFPMLIFRLLEHSTGVTARIGNRAVGHSLDWPTISRVESAATGTALLPDGSEVTGLPLDRPFDTTGIPGLYTLSVPGRSEQIAVNLAADESRTTPLTMEQLESYGLKLQGRDRPNDEQRQRDRQRQLQLAELEQSQKLWQQILFAVIAVVLLETFVSGWPRVSRI